MRDWQRCSTWGKKYGSYSRLKPRRRPVTTALDDVVDLCGGSDKDDDSVIDLTSEKDDDAAERRRRANTRCASTSA